MSTKEEDNFSRSFRNAVHHASSSRFENVRQLKPVQEEALLQFIRRKDVFCVLPAGCGKDVNKTDRPNTTPTVREICTFAVYFSVFRPFCRFTLVYEGHYVLLLTRILYSLTPGAAMIRAVCKYSRLILITVVIFVLLRFPHEETL